MVTEEVIITTEWATRRRERLLRSCLWLLGMIPCRFFLMQSLTSNIAFCTFCLALGPVLGAALFVLGQKAQQ